jgi:hypothetical protein
VTVPPHTVPPHTVPPHTVPPRAMPSGRASGDVQLTRKSQLNAGPAGRAGVKQE